MHKPRISQADREKVDEYFQSVRDIEVRLDKTEQWLARPKPPAPFDRPEGKLNTSDEIRVMYDLIVAAIQTDMTRVITYRQPVEGLFGELGFKVNGHSTTHCTETSEAYKASIARDQKQLELLAYCYDGEVKWLQVSGLSSNSCRRSPSGTGKRAGHVRSIKPISIMSRR